jgi:Zn finger protein HypA/HybF involved in hydrogenase expression
MKNVFVLLFLSFSTVAYSQVITEEELKLKVESAQEKCVGAHESIVQRTNEEFAKFIWGKKVRFNEANIIRFFGHPSGEKVSAGVDIYTSNKNSWGYSYDQKTAADLLIENGVRVTQSYNTLWISANQDLLFAENKKEGHKIILELYCPHQRFLDVLRTGQTQSIEFLITGYRASVSLDSKIYGVLTQVHVEKQVIQCSNGHEFDKDLGYKFCPTCGESIK